MSYLDLVDRVTLFRALRTIDIEIAASVRAGHCPHCGGPLHVADYERKPRGERIKIPEECRIRCGLCCGWCRQRAEVPSCCRGRFETPPLGRPRRPPLM